MNVHVSIVTSRCDQASDHLLQKGDITSDQVDLLTCSRVMGVTVVYQAHVHVFEATVMSYTIFLKGPRVYYSNFDAPHH